jgi:hypothetical protein
VYDVLLTTLQVLVHGLQSTVDDRIAYDTQNISAQ